MQATLIYNPHAEQNGEDQVDNLKEALREAGYEPLYKPTKEEADLDPILAEAEGLIVSAGGDGTARAVMKRLIGREDLHFTPLPMGTANNVCRDLGIEGKPLDILRRMKEPQRCGLDVGHVQAPWGEDYFLEGAGIGFFAEVLASYNPEKGKSVLRSLKSIVGILQEGFNRETILELPDQTIQDDFLLVEFLNTTAVGPHLKFAPDADPSDGLLNVICIKENQKEGYLNYLRGILVEDLHKMESVDVYKVPELKIRWRGFPVHVDAVVHPPGFDFKQAEANENASPLSRIRPFPDVAPEATITIRILPQALSVWRPSPAETA